MNGPIQLLLVQAPGEGRNHLLSGLHELRGGVQVVDSPGEARRWMETGARAEVVLIAHDPPANDGLAFLDGFREGLEGEGVAVVMLAPADRLEALRGGPFLPADDYLPLTVDHGRLRLAVRLQVHRVRQWRHALERRHRALLSYLPHELRTPLNGVLGCAEIIADLARAGGNQGHGEVDELVGMLRESGDRLLALMETVEFWLEVNDPGRSWPLATDPDTDWRPLVEQRLVTVVARRRREADLRLDLRDRPLPVPAHELARVTGLLVDNAAKFSAPGQPIHVEGGPQGEGYALRVLDRGGGMSSLHCSAVEELSQFDRLRQHQDGLGLGLATARAWVRQTGGRLQLRPRLGGGMEVVMAWADPAAFSSFRPPGARNPLQFL